MQGVILSPRLSTILLYDVSQWWSQYLNRCVDASSLEVVEAPGASVPFYLKPILVDMERGGLLGKNPSGTPGRPPHSDTGGRHKRQQIHWC